jgi:hypothetical protein
MKLLYLLTLFLAPLLQAQQLQPVESTQPDCGKFIAPITTAGTFVSATVNNKDGAGCDGWTVTYSSFGFATVSVLLQSAPMTTAGAAGTFVSFAGTILTGFTNPVTATTQGETRATGYYPYVRVQITTTGTGYLTAEFHGFKSNANAASAIISVVGTIQTQEVGNGTVLSNQQAVTAAAVALATNASRNICVKALVGNTANVYIGPTAETIATGMELAPGDSYCGPVSNTNLIFVIAAAVGQTVSWIATN